MDGRSGVVHGCRRCRSSRLGGLTPILSIGRPGWVPAVIRGPGPLLRPLRRLRSLFDRVRHLLPLHRAADRRGRTVLPGVAHLRPAGDPGHAGALPEPGGRRRGDLLDPRRLQAFPDQVDYKRSRIKQYCKINWALPTEPTVNDARDLGVGLLLHNRPTLREIGFSANRHLLEGERTNSEPTAGADAYDEVCRPVVVNGQRVPGLRFDGSATMALLSALVVLGLSTQGFDRVRESARGHIEDRAATPSLVWSPSNEPREMRMM